MHLFEIHRFGFKGDALPQVKMPKLSLNMLPAAVKNDGFADIIQKAHLLCFSAKIFAFRITEPYEHGG